MRVLGCRAFLLVISRNGMDPSSLIPYNSHAPAVPMVGFLRFRVCSHNEGFGFRDTLRPQPWDCKPGLPSLSGFKL